MLTKLRNRGGAADLDPFREPTREEIAEQQRQDTIDQAIKTRSAAIKREQLTLPPSERDSSDARWEQARKEVYADIKRNERAEKIRRVRADFASLHTRNRHLFGPWQAGLAYAAAGETGAVLTEVSGNFAVGGGLAVAGAAATTAVLWKKLKQVPERYLARFRLGLAAGCATCMSLPLLPWEVQWQAAGLAGGAAALIATSARYWRDNEPTYPPRGGYEAQDQPARRHEGDEVDTSRPVEVRDLIADWNDYVRDDGPLPGAELVWNTAFDNGHVFTVQLVRGKQKLDALTGKIEDIAYALNMPLSAFTVDPSPDPHQPLRPLLTVVTSRPDSTYTGPVVVAEGGSVFIELGPYTDGRGVARYEILSDQLTEEQLARGEKPRGNIIGGFLLGDKGSGKTKELEAIALGAMEVGIEVWYLDPQGGASSPLLRDHAAWSLMGLHSPDGRDYGNISDLAEALEGFTAVRQDENAALGWPRFQHSRQRPGLLVIIDECHQVFNAPDPTRNNVKFGIRFGEIDRVFQKVGGAFVGASQAPSQEVFGGSITLRNGMAGGNGYALKYNGANARLAFGGLDDVIVKGVQRLPINRGLGYAVNSDRPHATFQNRYTPNVERYFQARSQAGRSLLDDLATIGAGAAYAHRGASAQENLAAVQARLEGYRNGSLKPGEVGGKSSKTSKAGPGAGATGSGGNVYMFPGAASQQEKEDSAALTWESLTDRQRQIVEMLTGTRMTAKDLAAEFGVVNRTISSDLQKLREHKFVRVVDENAGLYTSTETLA